MERARRLAPRPGDDACLVLDPGSGEMGVTARRQDHARRTYRIARTVRTDLECCGRWRVAVYDACVPALSRRVDLRRGAQRACPGDAVGAGKAGPGGKTEKGG